MRFYESQGQMFRFRALLAQSLAFHGFQLNVGMQRSYTNGVVAKGLPAHPDSLHV